MPDQKAEKRPCKACGCPLWLVVGPNGKTIPLDLRSPVYTVGHDLVGAEVAVRSDAAFVSHFTTCPKADTFSKGKRR